MTENLWLNTANLPSFSSGVQMSEKRFGAKSRYQQSCTPKVYPTFQETHTKLKTDTDGANEFQRIDGGY